MNMGFGNFIKPTKSKMLIFGILLVVWIPVLFRDSLFIIGLLGTMIAVIPYFPVMIVGFLFFSSPGFVGPSLEMNGIYAITPLAIIWAWILACLFSLRNNKVKS